MAAGAPKAFVNLAGRPMLEHALDGLRNSGVVDSVVVAVPPNRTDEAKLKQIREEIKAGAAKFPILDALV